MKDRFHEKMKNKSDYELNNIVAKKDQFQIEAVNSAVRELARRRELDENEKQTLLDSEHRVQLNERTRIVEAEIDKNKPLFSKALVIVFSSLLHPIIGVIFFSANLWDYRKKSKIPISILIIFIFSIAQFYILFEFEQSAPYVGLANIAGGAIISDVLWRKFLGEEKRYTASRIW